MLKVSNLKIQYAKPLFSDVSFTLGNREKVGLVGFNGTGKSTLLRVIAGQEEPDAGSVESISEKIGYLEQENTKIPHPPSPLSAKGASLLRGDGGSIAKGASLLRGDGEPFTFVGEVLESYVDDHRTEMYRVMRALSRLNFSDVDFYQEVSTLSPGQLMKLQLTKLLVDECTILLLDEPTNHLDIYGILWLEEFIRTFDGICIIVSHDRAFLNSVINTVFEIDEQKLNMFAGNYDDYLEQKLSLLEKRATQVFLQEKKREKFESLIDRIKRGAPGKKQGKALKAARKRMQREVTNVEISSYREQKITGLNLQGQTHRTKLVLEIKDLDFGYAADKPLLEKANLNIFGKQRVWFYGANGIGKSTVVKLIMKQLEPTSGIVKVGDNLRTVYFSQDQSHLDFSQTVEDYFLKNTPVSYAQSFGALAKFMFDRDMRTMQIGRLSPGQRARLSFAVFAQNEYDFMILDEPTNHLDIKSKEVIEDALREFHGTILLISHDRYFVESIGVDRSVTIEDGEIVD